MSRFSKLLVGLFVVFAAAAMVSQPVLAAPGDNPDPTDGLVLLFDNPADSAETCGGGNPSGGGEGDPDGGVQSPNMLQDLLGLSGPVNANDIDQYSAMEQLFIVYWLQFIMATP